MLSLVLTVCSHKETEGIRTREGGREGASKRGSKGENKGGGGEMIAAVHEERGTKAKVQAVG